MNFQRRDFLSAGAAVATMTAAGAALAQGNPPAPSEASPRLSGTLPNNEKRLRIINLRDLETEAQKVMTRYGFVFVSGGAGDEWSLRENLAAFNRTVIVPSREGERRTRPPSSSASNCPSR